MGDADDHARSVIAVFLEECYFLAHFRKVPVRQAAKWHIIYGVGPAVCRCLHYFVEHVGEGSNLEAVSVLESSAKYLHFDADTVWPEAVRHAYMRANEEQQDSGQPTPEMLAQVWTMPWQEDDFEDEYLQLMWHAFSSSTLAE